MSRLLSSSAARILVPVAAAAVLTACGDPTRLCGAGTTEKDGTCLPETVSTRITSLTVSSLEVHGGPQSAFLVNHPISLSIGLSSSSRFENLEVAVGLAAHSEKLPTEPVRMCFLGSFLAANNPAADATGPTLNIYNETFVIPPECLAEGATSGELNLFVQPDPFRDQLAAELQPGAVFAPGASEQPNVKACTSTGAGVGCLFKLRVEKRAGQDLAVSRLATGSSVALLLYGQHDKLDEQSNAGALSMLPDPLLTAATTVQLFGEEPLVGEAGDKVEIKPHPVKFRVGYRIRPSSTNDAEWEPLRIFKEYDVKAKAVRFLEGNLEEYPSLAALHDNNFHHMLYPGQGSKLFSDWKKVTLFDVEVCADFAAQTEDAAFAGNNCRTTQLRIIPKVQAEKISAMPNDPMSTQKLWSQTWGNPDDIAVGIDLGTALTADQKGLLWSSWVSVPFKSAVLDIDLAKLNKKLGYQAGKGKVASLELSIVGITAYQWPAVAPPKDRNIDCTKLANRSDPLCKGDTLDNTWNVVKSKCTDPPFKYPIGPFSINLELCMFFKAGLDYPTFGPPSSNPGKSNKSLLQVAIQFEAAKEDSELKLGLIAGIEPYLTVGGTVKVYLNLDLVKAGVEGTVAILDVRAPFVFGLDFAYPVYGTYTLDGSFYFGLKFTSLSLDVDAFIDGRSVQWCKHWGIPYPCGLSWNRLYTKHIWGWDGFTKTIPLIDLPFTIHASPCGNGVREGKEQCDGSDFGGATCATVPGDYTGGTLACTADCFFDTTKCSK